MNWLHHKLRDCVDQTDEGYDLSEGLKLAIWLLDIIEQNNIILTEKQWVDYNRNVLGDEDYE